MYPLWIPIDKETFSSRFRYVEIARSYKDSVFRIQQDKVPVLLDIVTEVEDWRQKNKNFGLYTSVFQYDRPDLHNSLRLANLYFDLDSSDLELAKAEAQRLYAYLAATIPTTGIRLYFSGHKGFHIELEALALGITPDLSLADIFRFIASSIAEEIKLTTLDMAVYESRRMWRLVNSRHQKTNLYKIPLSPEEICNAQEIAQDPRELLVPAQEFNAQANEWYREYVYTREEQLNSRPQVMLERFLNDGTAVAWEDTPGIFNPLVFELCPSLGRLWKKAESTGHLLHEERLFLCSILTYSEEAEEYLYHILSFCSDFNYQKSRSHIEDWKRRREMDIGGRPLTCRKLNAQGIGCGQEHCSNLEPRPKWQKVGKSKIVSTGEFSEPSPIRWAYSHKSFTK